MNRTKTTSGHVSVITEATLTAPRTSPSRPLTSSQASLVTEYLSIVSAAGQILRGPCFNCVLKQARETLHCKHIFHT